MKRIVLSLFALVAWCSAAPAQNVTRIGPITNGDCASFSSPNTIQDGGFPCPGSGGTLVLPNGTTATTQTTGDNTTKVATDQFVQTAISSGTGLPAGVDQNNLNTQTTNYTIATTDCGKTVQAGTGSTGLFTVTLPSVAGFASTCTVTVINGDTGRGKKLSGFPTTMTSPNILWPSTGVTLKIVNGAWVAPNDPGRWAKQNLTFFIDTAGNDTNDGLASGAGAFLTLSKCTNVAELYIDTQSGGNGGITCSPTAGQTFQESLQVFFSLTGGGSLIFSGNGGAFIWKPVNSGSALQVGDLGVVGLTNVNFSSAGVTTPASFVVGHNTGIVDFNTGVSLTPTVAITNGFDCDYDTHFNINNGLTINAGTFNSYILHGCQNSTWNINGTETFVGTPTFNRYAVFDTGATATFQGNVVFSGASTGSPMLVADNATVNNFTSGFPGGTPITLKGGLICTAIGTCAANVDLTTDVINQLPRSNLAQGIARSVIGVTGNATANVSDIQGTADQVLVVNSPGTALAFGKVNLTAGAGATGTLPVANGGTGDTGAAWSAFTPSPACGTATFSINSARSKTMGKTTWFEFDIAISALGSCTLTMTVNLPNTSNSSGSVAGRDSATGKTIGCAFLGVATLMTCTVADGTTGFAGASRLAMSGVYENQ